MKFIEKLHLLALAKIEVIADGLDVALGQPVFADASFGNAEGIQQLTRRLRPQGKGIFTDNLQNITPTGLWRLRSNDLRWNALLAISSSDDRPVPMLHVERRLNRASAQI